MKYVVIIPSYNPDRELVEIVRDTHKRGIDKIIVIDDGSYDKKYFNEIEGYKYVDIIRHDKNMGKGISLKDGFSYYLDNYSDRYLGVVCMDSDGQHRVDDMVNVGNEMEASDRFVLGVRNFDRDGVPRRSRFGNKITSKVFRLFFGKYIKDTQTGLRGIPNRLIPMVLDSQGERFEYEMNMLIDMVRLNEEIKEVEIDTIYKDKGKRKSYFKPIRDSFLVYREIFKRRKK